MSRPLCRYFMSNCCNKGDNCSFSHERNARPEMVCKYYKAGHCEYGSKCRYDHIRPKPRPNFASEAAEEQLKIMKRIEKPFASSTEASSINAIPASNAKTHNSRLPVFQRLPSLKSEELRQQPSEASTSKPEKKKNGNAWAKPLKFSTDAPEFVPRQFDPSQINLCPYFEISGDCINGDACMLIHGEFCDMCAQFILHPFNEAQRAGHHQECLAEHEKAMKDAFINHESMKMQCGICMEHILEIGGRFGILQNCKHCFCLKCIREWRKKNESFEKNVVRACPQCRIHSDFIIPSSVWVEEQSEKDAIIANYQQNMSQKVCKYMANGLPEDCPFGNKCFYKHEMPDGSVVEGKSPKELRSRLNRTYRLAEALHLVSAVELLHVSLMEDLYDDDEEDYY